MENLLLSCIESRVENNRSFYGRFQLGPFAGGQGLTVANALRRTLLSELKGLAITSVKIHGASHEYSSLKGIRDSILSILLNLKQIVLTSDFEFKEPQIGYLDIQGPTIVTSSDLKLPISIQCVDPDQYIATLSHDGLLRMKFIISQGNNYVIQTPLEIKEKVFNKGFSLNKIELDQIAVINQLENRDIFISTSSPIISKFALLKNVKLSDKNIYNKKIKNQLIFSGQKKSQSLFNLKVNQFLPTFSKNTNHRVVEENKKFLPSSLRQNFRNKKIFNLQNIDNKGKTNLFEEKKEYPFVQNKNKQKNFLNNLTTKSNHLKSFSNRAEMKWSSGNFLKIEKNRNILPIDAVFMPINKVNFLLEADDDFEKKEKIILEIWTNGSIHPRQAIHEAAKSLICLFFPFQETRLLKSIFPFKLAANTNVKRENKFNFSLQKNNISFDSNRAIFAGFAFKQEEKKRFSIDIGNLDLSLRPYTCLKRANINTVGDLLQYSADELLLLKNFGKRSLEEVEKTLAQMNLKLRNQNSEDFLFLQKKT